jgi:hypothetical protein
MTLYLEKQAVGNWPEPLETTWQVLGGQRAGQLAPKLPHLGLADILFMTTVMSLPRTDRLRFDQAGDRTPVVSEQASGFTRFR